MRYFTPQGPIAAALFFSVALAFITGSAPATAQTPPKAAPRVTAQQLFEQAKVDFHRGNHEAARLKFNQILRRHPNHTLSRNYLIQIRQIADNRGGNPQMERQFQQLILPEIDVDGSTLPEVVEYLVLLSQKVTGGRMKPNILLRNIRPDQEEMTFRLKLNNVPLSYALDAIGQQARVKFRYERYAVVGTPLPRSGEGTAPPPPKPRKKPFWEVEEKKGDDLFD